MSSTRQQFANRVAFLGLPNFSPDLLHRHSRSVAAAAAAAVCIAINSSPISFVPFRSTAAATLLAEQQPNAVLPAPQLDAEHALVEETWGLVRRYFINSHKLDEKWDTIHQRLQQSSFRSRNSAYSAIRNALSSLDDPYTRFLTPTEMLALQKFDVSGVGLLLTVGPNDSIVVATTPAPGTPAAAKKIQRGDVLLDVEGESVSGRGAFEVAQQMQGEDGYPLKLRFRDAGDVVLTRSFAPKKGGPIGVNSFISVDKEDGRKVGHIQLSEFRASARSDVANALRKLHRSGAEAFVLDIRGNPGGVFQGALEIVGIFEGEGKPVARVSGRGELAEEYTSFVVGAEELEQVAPLAVIVDGGSASASEVLAGGLRDNCRAAILGNEKSYGKGLIQGVFGLSDGSGLILTVAEYVTPNGTTIQGQGIEPDLPLGNSFFSNALHIIGVDTPAKVDWNQVENVTEMCKANNMMTR